MAIGSTSPEAAGDKGAHLGVQPALTWPLALPAELDPAMAASLTTALEKALHLMVDTGQQITVLSRADRLAELATGLLEPQLELVEDRVHRMKTVNEVFGQGDWLTAEQINALQPDPPANKAHPASDWKRRGRIFSVNYGGKEYFARYQFDVLYQPLPIVKEVLKALGEAADPWVLASWFHFPNGWLNAEAPKDSLDHGQAVLAAAAKRQATYHA
ncbi:MAG TPA: hypothetical protein VLA61_11280 [Ideonella sp.]|uniref:hypothetical protein n=1 Tax=Ideonella sp. TaxID=1929293 RepID=UPI002C671D9F|nr:hypothetical protein [Ideonella sp.]HSI48845.1 hypothetical protein [Ideonella sp.]